ncbi:MAG TPA: TetR/AcrR family transcriptional regulator C-terminal domain-containing protein [Candidatus Scatomorpha pullistercoris]|uniref:TetR/AcrR family transcriptional regulator C-terminal domain-containing protein n=1 Tax=Candidatus Scatomorpha pullistercoris TaxID=2840929 RepID=A0A9D1K857_9FIRM|nr:TetR/AcrR family transcriptional regulator C-terminal domain-containing protein [Candidatus Scatomorpha pullistercoris]
MPEKKQDARVRYTKMVIRNSLLELLRTKPIAKITVTEICERADINRATFYAHYSDPSDLLHSLESEVIEDVTRWVRPALTAVGSDLKDVLTRLVEYIGENANICSVLLSDKGDNSFQSKVVKVIEGQFISSWASARQISQEDAEYLYTFIALGSVGLIRKWLAEGTVKPASEIAELILKISNAGYYGI